MTDRSVEVAQRVARVVELRRQRVSWVEIARAVGVDRRKCERDYWRAIAEIPAPHVDEHRVEELMLVDDATADLMIIARDEDVSPRTRIEAWSTIRAWAERKAKLLGLDAPTQVVTIDKVDQEIAALSRELEAMQAAVEPTESEPVPESSVVRGGLGVKESTS